MVTDTFQLHSHQAAAFTSTAKYVVNVAGRRGGKSEWAVLKIATLAHKLNLEGKVGVIWVVVPTYRLARPLWRKFERLVPEGWITDKRGSEAAPDSLSFGGVTVEFKTSSIPESLVAEGLLALWVDEAGTVKERAWEESLRPTLLDYDAPAILTGTPKGRNWFHRMFVRGEDPLDARVESFRWSSFENPFISREAVEELAREMPERMKRQEILAQFLSDEGAVFRGFRQLIAPELSTERTYCLGVDVAKHLDFTVIYGLDGQGNPTYWDRFTGVSWPIQKARIQAAQQKVGGTVFLDSTGVGDPILDDLVGMGVPVTGVKFSAQQKIQLVEGLALAIENQEIRLPDEPVLLNELDVYEYEITRSGYTKYNAPEGAHDDTVMALSLAVYGLKTRTPPQRVVHW